LASPCTGIVHHLSGPSRCAHTQIFCHRRMIGRWCGLRLPPQALRPLTFISHRGFVARVLAHMLDSLVRVTRRVGDRHFVRHPLSLWPSGGRKVQAEGRWIGHPQAGPTSLLSAAFPRSHPMLTGAAVEDRGRNCLPPLPFWQFQVLCTLFSKFFSSFPRGTCSLSVSC